MYSDALQPLFFTAVWIVIFFHIRTISTRSLFLSFYTVLALIKLNILKKCDVQWWFQPLGSNLQRFCKNRKINEDTEWINIHWNKTKYTQLDAKNYIAITPDYQLALAFSLSLCECVYGFRSYFVTRVQVLRVSGIRSNEYNWLTAVAFCTHNYTYTRTHTYVCIHNMLPSIIEQCTIYDTIESTANSMEFDNQNLQEPSRD